MLSGSRCADRPAIPRQVWNDAGREFEARERTRDVCVLNQAAAAFLFPRQPAIGRYVRTTTGVAATRSAERTREFGIRMALGASRRNVLRTVLRQGLQIAGLGISAGLVAALAATRLLRSLLYGVSPVDPATFVVVPLVLMTVSLLACLLPALRAARVDPMEAL